MLRFTICFIRQGNKVLLLNREKPAWIMHPENTGIGHNVPFFLEKMLNDEKKYEHRCIYEKDSLRTVKHLEFK